MMASTPHSAPTQYIPAGVYTHDKEPYIKNLASSFFKDDSDDDLNDEDIPGFGGVGTPLLPTPDKGKGRAPQNLASPGLPPPVASGNISTPDNAPRGSGRQSFGGVRVETRYAPTASTQRVISPSYTKPLALLE
jgi:hypothetical protein